MVFYLENNVGGVVNQHHQSAHPHIVGNVGETDENYGGNMMNYLLPEILKHKHTCTHLKTCSSMNSSCTGAV